MKKEKISCFETENGNLFLFKTDSKGSPISTGYYVEKDTLTLLSNGKRECAHNEVIWAIDTFNPVISAATPSMKKAFNNLYKKDKDSVVYMEGTGSHNPFAGLSNLMGNKK